jgi:predicted negative regulator of RcsB-dependent stress response
MQKAKDAYGTVQALRRFADICMIMGDEETALHLFHTTLDAGTKLDIHHVRAECMVGIGDIMLRRGDNVQAKKMWAAAHPLFLRSSRPKDARFIKEQLEQLTIQENDQHPTPSKGV